MKSTGSHLPSLFKLGVPLHASRTSLLSFMVLRKQETGYKAMKELVLRSKSVQTGRALEVSAQEKETMALFPIQNPDAIEKRQWRKKKDTVNARGMTATEIVDANNQKAERGRRQVQKDVDILQTRTQQQQAQEAREKEASFNPTASQIAAVVASSLARSAAKEALTPIAALIPPPPPIPVAATMAIIAPESSILVEDTPPPASPPTSYPALSPSPLSFSAAGFNSAGRSVSSSRIAVP